MRFANSLVGVLPLVLAAAPLALAQGPLNHAPPLPPGPELAPPVFADLKWRSIGPAATSGRIDDIAVGRVHGKPDVMYIGAATGGVWKSTDGGAMWVPVFDAVNGSMSIGAVAVAPSNPDIVWVGTGEANNPTPFWGDGIYKSTDAGKTWKFMGLKETRQVGRIAINPTNPDIVYIAAAGHMWGSNPERGIFKTADGGKTWKKVLYVDENTGANDVIIDPKNPQILYASTYQRQHKLWGSRGTGPGSNIYKSIDGGENWIKQTVGIPPGDKGRIAFDIYAGDTKIVYATFEATPTPADSTRAADSLGRGGRAGRGGRGGRGGARGGRGAADSAAAATDCVQPAGGRAGGGGGGQNNAANDGGVFRTLDGGLTWERMGTQLGRPPGYHNLIRVDPKDINRVYLLGSNRGFWISDNAGKTFTDVFTNVHSEDHALWLDPDDPNHMIIGGDGGLSISWDRGVTWEFRTNIPLGQYYEIGVDNRDPFTVCGGMQDNGEWCVHSAVRDRNGISNHDAWNIGGGDGFHVIVDPNDPNIAFEESQNGNVSRVDMATLAKSSTRPGLERPKTCFEIAVEPPPAGGRGRGGRGGAQAPRWNWDTPVTFSSFDPKVMYMGGSRLYKSTDRGGSWKAISPDVTGSFNRDTLKIMGQPVPARGGGAGGAVNDTVVASGGTIATIGESPLDARVLYTGSSYGEVYVTRDGGTNWTNITRHFPGLPPFTPVTTMQPSKFVAGRVYATFDGHVNDDLKPYVYVSEDYGQSWRSITNGLPAEATVNRLREHPNDKNFLVVAHDHGVHFSNDGGANWYSLATNMPTVPTDDIQFQTRDNSLVAGTFGRSIWVLDDITPLEVLNADGLKADALFVSATRGREWGLYQPQSWHGYAEWFAANPEFNSVISYYVRDSVAHSTPAREADIEISDAAGSHVRTMHAPVKRGLNRVVWDMHMDAAIPPAEMPGGRGGAGGRGGRGGGRGGADSLRVDSVAVDTAAAGRGGRGGQAGGPSVMPGKYHITIKIPGITHELRGDVAVEADPLEPLSATDRRARQDELMSVYALQKTLVAARIAARTVGERADSIKAAVASAGPSDAVAHVDSLAKRVTLLRSEVDRVLLVSSGLIRPVESFPTLPSADERQQFTWAFDDATRAITELNHVIQSEMPGAYAQYMHHPWQKVTAVELPKR